jgi:hypothetical protein
MGRALSPCVASATWPPEGQSQDGFGSCFTGECRLRTGKIL